MVFMIFLAIFQLCSKERSLWIGTLLFGSRIIGCDKGDTGTESTGHLLPVKGLHLSSPGAFKTVIYGTEKQHVPRILGSGKCLFAAEAELVQGTMLGNLESEELRWINIIYSSHFSGALLRSLGSKEFHSGHFHEIFNSCLKQI